ncbi:11081_t:CDS:1, partial [Dentiscutata erythropus]
NKEILQKSLDLLANKEELINKNNDLKNKVAKFEVKIEQQNQELLENKKIIDSQIILLKHTQDIADHYKASNFKEFDEFIYKYTFGLFDIVFSK